MLSFLPTIIYITIAGHAFPIIAFFSFIGIIIGLTIVLVEAARLHLCVRLVMLIYLIYFVFANILSRGGFILSRVYLHHDFQFQEKVLSFYPIHKVSVGILLGLVLAILLGVYLYDRWEDLFKYYDVFFLGLIAHIFFIRFGDAMTHYHPGKITSAFWGVYYLGAYRHEPSLYQSFCLILIFIFAFLIRRKVKMPGFLSLIILTGIGISRFVTDFFRNTDLPITNTQFFNSFYSPNYHLGFLSLSQIFFFLVLIFSLGAIFYIFKTKGNVFGSPEINTTLRDSIDIHSPNTELQKPYNQS